MSGPAGNSTFDQERAAILATAVGIARVRLQDGDSAGALEVLDSAAEATGKLKREWMLSLGYSAAEVDAFLMGHGAAVTTKEVGSA